MRSWTILTGEYPPDCGGVGDYTARLASGLAAEGDRVVVCTPKRSDGRRLDRHAGVKVVELPDHFGPLSRHELARRLDVDHSQVLVQYVPNAFGARGANLPWCRWLLQRSRRHGDDVRVMFHEPYFCFEWTRPDRVALALVQRMMTRTLLAAASEVYAPTDAWHRYLRPYAGPGFSLTVLPIPSSIPCCDRHDAPADVRARLLPPGGSTLVGHFGTYGAHIASMLRTTIPALLEKESGAGVVCIGQSSEAFVEEMVRDQPTLRGRLKATGRLPAHDAAISIAACDLLLQPFPDGVTTRRTSLMAGLVNGRPVVTTSGALTEPVWSETGAVALVPAADRAALVAAARRLIADPDAGRVLGARGGAVYRSRFAMAHTLARLRGGCGAGDHRPDHNSTPSSRKGAAA